MNLYFPRFALAAGLAATLVGAPARADLIPDALSGVSAYAFEDGDNVDPGDGSLSRSVDGSGLTVGNPLDPLTWTHDEAWQNNWQGNEGGAVTIDPGSTPGAWWIADLGSVQSTLDQMWVWNVRETNVPNRGSADIDIYYATSPTVAPANNGAYDFASGGWTMLTSTSLPIAPGGATAADATIDISGISSARYVGLNIKTNHGSDFRTGLAEVQFTTGAVPEPGSLVLAALALLGSMGMVLLRRRRMS